MDTTRQYEKTIQLRIDKKISSLKEFIYQLKENQTLLTIETDREALINACNSLEKYEEISNQLHNSEETKVETQEGKFLPNFHD